MQTIHALIPARRFRAFTLAELLIALAILGVIATFTIPKVLQAQQNSSYNSIAKETASAVTAAFTTYKLNNTVTAATAMNDLTPYLNYVAQDTATVVDYLYAYGTQTCDSRFCYKLHSGAMLYWWPDSIGGTATTNAMLFIVDPDGKSDGTTNNPGKSIQFYITYPGRLYTYGYIPNNLETSSGPVGAGNPAYDPPWFSW